MNDVPAEMDFIICQFINILNMIIEQIDSLGKDAHPYVFCLGRVS